MPRATTSTGAIAAGVYPSPPARDLYFVVKGKPGRPVLAEFLEWVLTEGQRYVAEMGYIAVATGPDRLRPGRRPGGRRETMRLLKDAVGRRVMGLVTTLPGLLVLLIVVGLFLKSKAILGVEPLSRLLFSSAWHPLKGQFGLLPFITGTVWVTVTALVLAVPVSILDGDLPVRIRPALGPRSGQAHDRPPGRIAVGRLRRLGRPPGRALRRRTSWRPSRASTPPATASSPAASCWPS